MALPNSASVVLLASNYNPSIISKEWLYQKGIFTEPVNNFVHTPMLALIENENFGFVVDAQRLQIVIKRITQDNLAKSNAMVSKFVDILPETPYKTVGLNYHYTIAGKGFNLKGFLSPKLAKLKAVFSPSFQLGAIMVFPFEEFVATFTATPSLTQEQPIRIAFNFHANVANVEEVRTRVASQFKTLQKAELIIEELCKNG